MSTIANALKQEIARVARKELKAEIAAVRKQTTSHRSEIAALKRELKTLQSAVRSMKKALPTVATPIQDLSRSGATMDSHRRAVSFSAERLAAHRQRLGITQGQMAQLIGASTLSVSKWESGKVQPRAAQREQIDAALKLGKRAAHRHLEAHAA